jgi:MoaA/NifB/PqqE/SkfB family radical SAM enzyme
MPDASSVESRSSDFVDIAWHPGGQATIDLTSFCNLRCVYCYQSRPDYHGQTHIDLALLTRVISELKEAGVKFVRLAGEGEVTVYKGWDRVARQLHEADFWYAFMTNLSLPYTPDQILTLARARELTVSLDTLDPELLARVRRGSELSRILDNLSRIAAAAAQHGLTTEITQNCVVYFENVHELPDIVRQAPRYGFKRVALLGMNTALGSCDGITSIHSLSEEQRREAMRHVHEAVAVGHANGIAVQANEIIHSIPEGTAPPAPPPVGSTRLCTEPWQSFFIRQNGKAGPCCILQEVGGDLNEQSVTSIIRGPKLRAMRAALLAGDLEHSTVPEVASTCARCSNYPKGTPEQLRTLLLAPQARHSKKDLSAPNVKLLTGDWVEGLRLDKPFNDVLLVLEEPRDLADGPISILCVVDGAAYALRLSVGSNKESGRFESEADYWHVYPAGVTLVHAFPHHFEPRAGRVDWAAIDQVVFGGPEKVGTFVRFAIYDRSGKRLIGSCDQNGSVRAAPKRWPGLPTRKLIGWLTRSSP